MSTSTSATAAVTPFTVLSVSKLPRGYMATLRVQPTAGVVTSEQHFIVAVDISGSMAGSPARAVERGLRQLGASHPHPDDEITLLYFNTYTFIRPATTARELAKGITLPIQGGTSITRALQAIQQLWKPGYDVLFMTDGQDGGSAADYKQAIGVFKQFVAQHDIKVHVMGIGNSADTKLLFEIATGTMGVGRDGDETASLIESVLDYASPSLTILGQRVMADANGVCHLYMETLPSTKEEWVGAVGDVPEAQAPSDDDLLNYFASRVEAVSRHPPIKKSTLDELVDEMRDTHQAFMHRKGNARHQLVVKLAQQRSLVERMYGMVDMDVSRLGQDLLALVQEARIAKGGDRFARRAANRMQQNIDAEEQRIAAVTAAAEAFAQSGRQVEDADGPVEERCMISTYSASELVADGDCLGIGVYCRPSDVGVVNPTHLRIDHAACDYFGYNAFNTAKVWGLASHKEFKSTNGLVVSHVLPLYLNDDHWSVAKHMLPLAAGAMATGNPMLGTAQLAKHSLLALLDALDQLPTNDFVKRVRRRVEETLKALARDNPSMVEHIESFASQASNRPPPTVLHLPRFERLCHVLSDGDLTRWHPHMSLILKEERHRLNCAHSYTAFLATCGYKDTWSGDISQALQAEGITLGALNEMEQAERYRWLREHGLALDEDAIATADETQIPWVVREERGPLINAAVVLQNILHMEHKERVKAGNYVDFLAPEDVRPRADVEQDARRFLEHHLYRRLLTSFGHDELKASMSDVLVECYRWTDRPLDYIALLRQRMAAVAHDADATRALLAQQCYVGRNITAFASAAVNRMQLEMIVHGEGITDFRANQRTFLTVQWCPSTTTRRKIYHWNTHLNSATMHDVFAAAAAANGRP